MKQKLFLLLCLAFMVGMQAQDRYVAPDGLSTNSGTTEADPWDLQTALNTDLGEGYTIWLAGGQYDGRYTSTISGTSADPIIVKSADGEWAVLNGNVPKYNDDRDKGVLMLPDGNAGSSYVHFMNFEITSILSSRPEFTRDIDDPNYIGYVGVNHLNGVDCKFINLVIHDLPYQGVGSWKSTGGTEFYGCVVYNNGRVDSGGTRQYEHGFYIQNNTDSIRKFRNNVVFNNFGKGMIFWSSSQCNEIDDENGDTVVDPNCDFLKNALFDNNAVFNNGNVLYADVGGGKDNIEVSTNDSSGQKVPKNVVISNNTLYHNTCFTDNNNCTKGSALTSNFSGGLSIGKVAGNAADNITITNNLIAGRGYALRLNRATNLEFKNNIVYSRKISIGANNEVADIETTWDFDFNKYFTKDPSGFDIDIPGTGDYWLNANVCIDPINAPVGFWTDYGLDIHSTWGYPRFFEGTVFPVFTEDPNTCDPDDFPSLDSIKITKNEYNPNQYTVVIVNPSNLEDVIVSFNDFGLAGSGDIQQNAQYKLRDVENYHAVVDEGTINSSFTVSIPMNLPNFEAPLKPLDTEGTLSDGTKKTPNNFGVFIIEFENKCATETTWNGTVWDNGAPSETIKAIIDADYSAATHGEFTACSLEVTTNGSMAIEAGLTITVVNNVANLNVDDVANGDFAANKFVISDNASLVMVNDDGIVTGNYTVEKEFSEFIEGDPDRYQLWSTPVEEVGSLPKDVIFSLGSVAFYFNAGNNAFDGISNGSLLTPGLGYYIRQNDIDMSARLFQGTLNNGTITSPASINPSADVPDSFNFYGNPYPSAIDWFKFAEDNADVLEGNTVYFWKQQNPSIAYQQQPPQWVVLNDTGSVPIGEGITGTANQYISTAQGFTTEVVTAGEVIFKNSQRVAGNNDQFFDNENNEGKMWLNLKTSSTGFDQILLAFVDPVTSDAKYNNDGAGVELYSLDGEQKLAIQATDALREQNVIIPLGFNASEAGDYSFNIEQEFIDPNFNIILEDTELNTFTDLRLGDYNFTTTEASSSDTRFRLNFNYVDPIDASFNYEKDCYSYGFTLDFSYTGDTEGVTFAWDFGPNAYPETSTNQNPEDIYFPFEGDEDITLTVTKDGSSNSETQVVTIQDVGTYITPRGRESVIICHNGETRIIRRRNLWRHLRHGDCIGPCDTSSFSYDDIAEDDIAELDESIVLYPNPTSNVLNIKLKGDQEFDSVKIMDISGRIVLEKIISESDITLPVSDLTTGIYFVSIELENKLIAVN